MIERQLTQADVDRVFDRDFTFRDVFAYGMTRTKWHTLFEFLRNRGLVDTIPSDVEDMVSGELEEESPSLPFVDPVSGLLFVVHMIVVSELEYTIDIREIDDVDDMMNALRFASEIGDALDIELRLTWCSFPDSVIGTYVPTSRIWSFGNFGGEPYEVRV